jgi:NMD protein affecting ribosome stability and mRNA decay
MNYICKRCDQETDVTYDGLCEECNLELDMAIGE